MSKQEKTYVDSARFESIVRAMPGLSVEVKAAWVKVQAQKGRCVYVPKARSVGRVDISGFKLEVDGVRDLGDASFGSVTQELVFEGRSADDILTTFALVLEHMLTLPAREVVRRRRAQDGSAQGWSFLREASSIASAPDSSAPAEADRPDTSRVFLDDPAHAR